MQDLQTAVSLAEAAGFTTAATQAKQEADRARRLMLAYEFHRFVTQQQIDSFNERLKTQTIKRTGRPGIDLREHYDVLAFTPVNEYKNLPPADVLEKVKQARDRRVFDTLEVAAVESVVEYKDPIVFGRIAGCSDRFYIAAWDDDVKLEDLIGPLEG